MSHSLPQLSHRLVGSNKMDSAATVIAAKVRITEPSVTVTKADNDALSTLQAFIKLGRPKFLPYSAILLLMGSMFASQATGEAVRAGGYVPALAFVWTAHLMTHYCGEYFDLAADRLNDTPTKWTGGSRVLVDGRLPPWSALVTALVLTTSAIVQLWCAAWQSTTVYRVAALIIALSWAYATPPVKLHYRSFGELTVATVLTTLVPLFGYYTQRSMMQSQASIPHEFVAVIAILSLQQWARMTVMNIPDVVGDLKANKVTFAARVGVRRAALGYATVQTLLPVLAIALLPVPLAIAFLTLVPLGLKTATRLRAATQTGAWQQDKTTVDIPFKASIQCAASALALTIAAAKSFVLGVLCKYVVAISVSIPLSVKIDTGASFSFVLALLPAILACLVAATLRRRLVRYLANAAMLVTFGLATDGVIAPAWVLLPWTVSKLAGIVPRKQRRLQTLDVIECAQVVYGVFPRITWAAALLPTYLAFFIVCFQLSLHVDYIFAILFLLNLFSFTNIITKLDNPHNPKYTMAWCMRFSWSIFAMASTLALGLAMWLLVPPLCQRAMAYRRRSLSPARDKAGAPLLGNRSTKPPEADEMA
ncbi:hypothetical protein RI367_007088 [Sorochytrium milnesiophthora]